MGTPSQQTVLKCCLLWGHRALPPFHQARLTDSVILLKTQHDGRQQRNQARQIRIPPFHEQREQQLSWYTNMTKLIRLSGPEPDNVRPQLIQDRLCSLFDGLWNNARFGSSKLEFYNITKPPNSISRRRYTNTN